MKTRLKLFFKWGIKFENAYSIEEKSERKVQYADCREVEAAVLEKFPPKPVPVEFMNGFDDPNGDAVSKKHSPKTRKRAIWHTEIRTVYYETEKQVHNRTCFSVSQILQIRVTTQ